MKCTSSPPNEQASSWISILMEWEYPPHTATTFGKKIKRSVLADSKHKACTLEYILGSASPWSGKEDKTKKTSTPAKPPEAESHHAWNKQDPWLEYASCCTGRDDGMWWLQSMPMVSESKKQGVNSAEKPGDGKRCFKKGQARLTGLSAFAKGLWCSPSEVRSPKASHCNSCSLFLGLDSSALSLYSQVHFGASHSFHDLVTPPKYFLSCPF